VVGERKGNELETETGCGGGGQMECSPSGLLTASSFALIVSQAVIGTASLWYKLLTAFYLHKFSCRPF
jgi:hypothetical protein